MTYLHTIKDTVDTWANNARPGERVVYASRHVEDSPNTVHGALHPAFQAHELGLVFLAQRRCGDRWSYEATRVSPETAKLLKIGQYAQ